SPRWMLARLLDGSEKLEERTKLDLKTQLCTKSSRKGLLRALRGLQTSWPSSENRRSWLSSIQKIPHPSLILWGVRDELNSVEIGLSLTRTLQDSSFFQNENCGHWPTLEDPGWVVTKIRHFLFQILAPV